MKVFVNGSCEPANIFTLIDPSSFSEAEFEVHVLNALRCVYRDYHCIPFRGGFEFDGGVHEADLALVHKSFSHWYVLEVELASHSLYGHVVPQITSFRYGSPQLSCIDYLVRFIPDMTEARAESLIRFVPYAVAVIANRLEPEWIAPLRAVDSQLITVSVFERFDGGFAHETEGSLYLPHESLGFFLYSALDRSIRVNLSTDLSVGVIQIEDPYGNVGLWTVRSTSESLWITKNVGDPGLPDNQMLQVMRTQAGKITLRLPGSIKRRSSN